jgi:predicted phosphoadenosine phosphosulfate sulfurtransferase
MEKYNFNLKDFTERFKKFFSNLGKVAIIVTAMASGYAASEIYHRYETTVSNRKMFMVRSKEFTKVWANDKEVLILDTKTGTTQIFEMGVFDPIFNFRVNQIYNDQKSK